MDYTDKDIRVQKGLKAVQRNVGFYLGDHASAQATFQCVKEICDNCLDEYLAGFATEIIITIDNKTITIADNGRGIPQKSLVKVFGTLHAGAKDTSKKTAYKVSAGLHGVGAACTNAVSKWLKVWSIRDKKCVYTAFKNAKVIQEEKKVSKSHSPIKVKTGTVVSFELAKKYLKITKPPLKRLKTWFDNLQLLCPGLRIKLTVGNKETIYYSKKGMQHKLTTKSMYFNKEGNVVSVEGRLDFMKDEEPEILYFVNTIPISQGVHTIAIENALKNAVKEATGIAPKVGALREITSGVVHCRIAAPILEGQTKNKLGGGKHMEKLIYDAVFKQMESFFHSNTKFAKKIVNQLNRLQKIQDKYKKELRAQKSFVTTIKKGKLPVKLARATTKKRDAIELFLVEGDSAGGPCKRARFRDYQEVLALRGKILNTASAKNDRVFSSKEVHDITLAMGDTALKKRRVGKVFIVADPDTDGKHIRTLLLAFFEGFFPEWVDDGRIFTIDLPLFHMIHKGKRVFGQTHEEVLAQTNGKGTPMRAKGLGEMSDGDLRYMAMDPKTRLEIPLTSSTKSRQYVLDLLGKQGGRLRKELIGMEVAIEN